MRCCLIWSFFIADATVAATEHVGEDIAEDGEDGDDDDDVALSLFISFNRGRSTTPPYRLFHFPMFEMRVHV